MPPSMYRTARAASCPARRSSEPLPGFRVLPHPAENQHILERRVDRDGLSARIAFSGGGKPPGPGGEVDFPLEPIKIEDRGDQIVRAEHVLILELPADRIPGEPVEHGADQRRTVGSVRAQALSSIVGCITARTRSASFPQGSMRKVSPCRLQIRALLSAINSISRPPVFRWTRGTGVRPAAASLAALPSRRSYCNYITKTWRRWEYLKSVRFVFWNVKERKRTSPHPLFTSFINKRDCFADTVMVE